MAKHLSLGKQGELLAENYLINKGYNILTCNYRYQKFELDIIALKDEVLIFVEVKTRSTDWFGNPEEAVGMVKEQNMAQASEAFIYSNEKLQYIDIRFDIISIIISDAKKTIKHIEDAFFPKNF